jgi:hypothetical protein
LLTYKTADDAIRGIQEKDRVIAELKAKVAQATPPPTTKSAEGPKSYLDNPDQLFDELVAKASSGDKRGYVEAIGQYIREQTSQNLSPYAPMLSEVSHEKASRQLEAELPGSRQWIESGELESSLAQEPLLASAIQNARANPQLAGQLHELYRMAYLSSLGRRMPQLVQSASAQAQAAPQPTPRPTLQATTPGLTPSLATQQYRPDDLSSKESRRAIIERGNERGIGSADWRSAGL